MICVVYFIVVAPCIYQYMEVTEMSAKFKISNITYLSIRLMTKNLNINSRFLNILQYYVGCIAVKCMRRFANTI